MKTIELPSTGFIVRESALTMLWQAGEIYDENGDVTLESYDEKYDADDTTATTRAQIVADFMHFVSQIPEADLTDYMQRKLDAGRSVMGGWSQMIHDYWLTRNGHGVGFWDRGLGGLGDRLTELAGDGSYDVFTDHVDHGNTGVWYYE